LDVLGINGDGVKDVLHVDVLDGDVAAVAVTAA
jgi:hypothetical protein